MAITAKDVKELRELTGAGKIVPVTDEEIRLAVQFLSELDFLSESVDSPAAY